MPKRAVRILRDGGISVRQVETSGPSDRRAQVLVLTSAAQSAKAARPSWISPAQRGRFTATRTPKRASGLGREQPQANGCFWPILLKKSVSERAACRQLKNRSISALLRKNQDSFRLLSEPDFNVANDLAWTKIAAGLFQQNWPGAVVRVAKTQAISFVLARSASQRIAIM